MVAIHNQTGHEFVRRELLPDEIRMPGQDSGATVAEMGRKGRTRPDRIANLLRSRRCVPNGHANAGGHEVFDERDRPAHFGRQRDQHDAPFRRFLATLEIIKGCRPNVRPRMRAAWAVGFRDVRSFHVNARNGRILDADQDSRATRKIFKGRRNQRWQQSRDPGGAHGRKRVLHLFWTNKGIIEINARKAIDLQIEEAGEFQSGQAGAGGRSPGGG